MLKIPVGFFRILSAKDAFMVVLGTLKDSSYQKNPIRISLKFFIPKMFGMFPKDSFRVLHTKDSFRIPLTKDTIKISLEFSY